MKAKTSSNLNQIRPLTRELPAFEHLKNQCIVWKNHHILLMEKMLSTL